MKNVEKPKSTAPIRLRAVLLGLLLVPLHCWWALRTEIFTGGSELIEGSLLPLAVFTFFLLVAVNSLLQRASPRLALSRVELLFVYVMQTTSLGVAGLGQLQFLNQALVGIYRPSPTDSQWKDYLPFVPHWWVPDPAVVADYLKGNSTLFTREHLRGWAIPFVVWTGFILVLYFAFLCLNTLLRRHWIENERLPFPLMQIPLELTQERTGGPLLRNYSFWIAFVLVCLIRSISALHRVEPSFPEPPLFGPKGQLIDIGSSFIEHPWNAIGYFRVSFHPLIIGVTYFLPLDVSFSQWFFYLVVKAEIILAAALGYRGSSNPASAEIPFNGEQGAGAFLAIALFSLWSARRHLQDVFAKAFGERPTVCDADEPLSYATAVFGLGACFIALVAFVALGGIPWGLGALFFALYLLMILTVTRLRAEAGPMLNYGPDMNPHRMLVLLPGTRTWDTQGLTAFSYLNWFDSDYRTVAMPPQLEALKMAEATHLTPRKLAGWMLVAATLATLTAFVSVVALNYHYGALSPQGDNGWRAYNGFAPFQMLHNWVRNPQPADTNRLGWIGVGFAATSALIQARARFFWWPFHPVGFALAQAGFSLPWVWFPTLLGWAAKALILRYGGMTLYRRAIPFFVGLILGDIVVACLWSLIGVILDTQMYMFFPG